MLIPLGCMVRHRWEDYTNVFLMGVIGLGIASTIAIICVRQWMERIQLQIRREEAAKRPAELPLPGPSADTLPFEYRSPWTLLGLPLIHVRRECRRDGKLLPAKGWIAIGNIAYGALTAHSSPAPSSCCASPCCCYGCRSEGSSGR
jgi:hypothetical protein